VRLFGRRRPTVLVVEPTPATVYLAAREAAFEALRETHPADVPTAAILTTFLRQVPAP
jgi:hypothetical protein